MLILLYHPKRVIFFIESPAWVILFAGKTGMIESKEREAMRVNGLERELTLTAREREVVDLLLRGYTQKLVTDELEISPNTLKTHLRHIYRKSGIHSRTELIRQFEEA